MRTIRLLKLALAAAIVLATSELPARASGVLYAISPYNVYVSGSFNPTVTNGSDTEGGLAVGGSSSPKSYGIAGNLHGQLLTSFTNNSTFVIAGNLTGTGGV